MFSLRSSSRLISRRTSPSFLSAAFCRSESTVARIIYTQTDEAPALATFSLLPIVRTFAAKAGIQVEKVDISLAARIIAQFPKYLTDEQKGADTLAELGVLCKLPEANIIK
jgi:isocitrate dehydrogenase